VIGVLFIAYRTLTILQPSHVVCVNCYTSRRLISMTSLAPTATEE